MISAMRCISADGAIAGARVAAPSGIPPLGTRALLFVHGVGSTAAIWDAQLEAFGNDYQCAAVELRGNGAHKPDPDPKLISRRGFAQVVLSVAEALNFESFTLVGCSLGGVVAFELWQRAPERFDAMAILGSFACYPDGQRYAENVARAVQEAGDMRTFAKLRAGQLGLPPDRVRQTIQQMACKSVPCYLAATEATWTGDYRNVLSTINVPVLVAYGEKDVVAPRVLSEEIADGITGSQLVSIRGAGHVANADNPDEFNGVLGPFIDCLSRGR